MTGQSRLLYHAVPRIVPAPLNSLAEKMGGSCEVEEPVAPSAVMEPLTKDDWAVCSQYIQSSRINITVRQVLAPEQCFPESLSSARHQEEAAGGCTSKKRKADSS